MYYLILSFVFPCAPFSHRLRAVSISVSYNVRPPRTHKTMPAGPVLSGGRVTSLKISGPLFRRVLAPLTARPRSRTRVSREIPLASGNNNAHSRAESKDVVSNGMWPVAVVRVRIYLPVVVVRVRIYLPVVYAEGLFARFISPPPHPESLPRGRVSLSACGVISFGNQTQTRERR